MQQTRPHPITGAPMAPVGYVNGKAVWPVAGGAPDGDEGGSSGSAGSTGSAPASTSTAGTGTPAAPTATGLSQEAVDALIKDRVARAKEAERAKFADYDDVKGKAARLDAIEAENASTLDKERAKAKAEGASEVLTKANSRLVAAEVRAQAAHAKFRDPLDALAHLQVSGALANVKVTDDGDVDTAAITAALETLAKDKAYLLVDTTPPPPPPPATPGAAGVGAGSSGKGSAQVSPGVGRMRDAYGKAGQQ